MAEPDQNARYFVVQTKNSAESYAYEFLTNRRPYSQRSFDVYYPRILVERSHGGRRQFVERPFLARLMFVRDDGRGTDELRSAPGVSSLLSGVRARQSEINKIRSREFNGFVRLEDLSATRVQELRRDDKCRFNSVIGATPMTFEAIFQQHTSVGRAEVLFYWLGAMRPANVELKDLELA